MGASQAVASIGEVLRVAAATSSITGQCCPCSGLRRLAAPCHVDRPAPQLAQGECALLLEGKDHVLWAEREQAIGILGLGSTLTVDSQQTRQLAVGHTLQQTRLPAERCGGHGHGTDGVSQVVVAVAERALAVLPGLAPVDGGETHQHAARR